MDKKITPARVIAAAVCIVVIFAIALSPLTGPIWDGLVLVLMLLGFYALGQGWGKSIAFVAAIVLIGYVALPMLLG